MNGFELQAWHVLVILSTLVLTVIKGDVSNAIKSVVIIIEQRSLVGKTVLLLSPAGNWDQAVIDRFQLTIPFLRSGGVYITYQGQNEHFAQEKVYFSNWYGQRIRVNKVKTLA